MNEPICPRCKTAPRRAKKAGEGFHSYCVACIRLKTAEWKVANADRKRETNRIWQRNNTDKRRGYRKKCRAKKPEQYALAAKNAQLKREYGIDLTEFNELLDVQGNRCCLCHEVLTKPQVDHCHLSGIVRGILCHLCNPALGAFRENPKILRRAANYVEMFQRLSALSEKQKHQTKGK